MQRQRRKDEHEKRSYPAIAIELRERYRGIEPAYHMNKRMWNDLYMNRDIEDVDVKKWIRHSYDEVVKKLPKTIRQKYIKIYE